VTTLWEVGPGDLVDNYKQPLREIVGGWPLFHPSEADPDAGYTTHPLAVDLEISAVTAPAYALRIEYLVLAARYARLEVIVNGVAGAAHLRPRPSTSGEIRLHAGLHTTLYGDGAAEVVLPASLLRPGTNRIELVARDDGETIRVDNPEAVKRLDRMANAAGLVYQRLVLEELAAVPETHVAVDPSVVWRGGRELCSLHVELAGAFAGGDVVLEVPADRVELTLPAAPFGHLAAPFELADGGRTAGWTLSGALAARGTLTRRRKWRVHVTPHAHTDIGYTHRQAEVAERTSFAIDSALAQPEPSSYHLDSAWGLEHWLATRTNREALRGRVAVSGTYVDLLTQGAALEDLVRNELLACRLLREAGLSTGFAAVVDVPSLSSSFPDVLAGAGLRRLVHANNQDRGPFRLNGNLHHSSPFWWEGNAGGRVLVWLAKMYCELRKVCGSPPTPSSAARGLDLWLAEYERDDYPLDVVLLYGQEADNTDLDAQPLEFVRRWNETYDFPRLVFSDVDAFFAEVEAADAELPTLRGDGGAYWEDGLGSDQAATAAARAAQADLPAAERLAALAPGGSPVRAFDETWRQLLLWDEHTWGAFLSATDPDALLQREQWEVKRQFATRASLDARQLLHAAATRHALQWRTDGRELVVHNPHSWPAGGAVLVEVEHDEDVDAPTRCVQAGPTQQVLEAWIDELPPLSYRRLPLRRGARVHEPLPTDETVIENGHYRLELDAGRGCVASLVDRALGRELVDGAGRWGFGQLVQALGGEGTRIVSNQADLPEAELQLATAFDPVTVECRRFDGGATLLVGGTVEGGVLAAEWTLRDRAKHVDVAFRWRKEERRRKEAAYVAFAADLPGAEVWSDSQLGWVQWGRDELPGACQEWLPLQSAMLVRGDGCDLLLCSPDVPLFCVGDVVRGRWPITKAQRGGHVLSYVLNNYWHTNYKASQGGELAFRYRLASAGRIDLADAYRLGAEARRPPYAHRLSFQDFRETAPLEAAYASVEPDHVVLTTLKAAADGRGLVARFQEIAGRAGRARLSIPGRSVRAAWATDLVERDLRPLDGLEVAIEPWGLATIRFELA
jgi:hypothetical protein